MRAIKTTGFMMKIPLSDQTLRAGGGRVPLFLRVRTDGRKTAVLDGDEFAVEPKRAQSRQPAEGSAMPEGTKAEINHGNRRRIATDKIESNRMRGNTVSPQRTVRRLIGPEISNRLLDIFIHDCERDIVDPTPSLSRYQDIQRRFPPHSSGTSRTTSYFFQSVVP